MTQLNLLPDVKLEYLRSTRQKRLVIAASLLVAAASVAVMLLLSGVAYGLQKKNLSDLNRDIKTYNDQLKSKNDLGKILTIQNQLAALPGLHDQKPVTKRLFDFLTQITPTAASISQFQAKYDDNSMTITGSASSLDVANTYIDTLKFTKYQKTGDNAGSPQPAFSNVVLSQFTRNTSGANYTITLNFDPAIFDSASDVKLIVPQIVSTRSATEQPTDLFQQAQPQTGASR